jgi:hypothetical protein
MVRGEYHPSLAPRPVTTEPRAPLLPAGSAAGRSALDTFVARLRAGELSFDELLANYCSLIMARSPNLTAAARKLGKHRVTVQERLDANLVEAFRAG